MHWIYEVIVRPVLGYGATICLNGKRTQYNRNLLNGVQRLANVLITGAMPSTPAVALWCDYWEPTRLRTKEEFAKGVLRFKNLNHWQQPPSGKLNDQFITTNEKLLKSIPEVKVPHDQKTSSLNIDQGFTVDITKRDRMYTARPMSSLLTHERRHTGYLLWLYQQHPGQQQHWFNN